MINQIHVGLPVADLKKATAFYKKLGFTQDMNFSGDIMSQFEVTDVIQLSIFEQKNFMQHITNPSVDKSKFGLVSSALSVSSKEDVDELVQKALASGASRFMDMSDNDFMYMDGFTDLDGHMWSVYYMKM